MNSMDKYIGDPRPRMLKKLKEDNMTDKAREGKWLEEYACGCTNVQKYKYELPGYCPKHGDDKIQIYKLPELVKIGLN